MQKICQSEINNPAALYIVEAPMGEGKTECAFYLANAMCHAHGQQGIYFALPTMATSNQMYTRFNALLEENELSTSRLLHAMAWLVDLSSPTIQTEDSSQASAWLAPLRRGLLTNYAVGTVDQAMMAVLKSKYTVLRLIGLSSKVLIIDEIHAYDTYMSQILDRLLSWCRALKIPVILLSATLPSARKENLLRAYGASASIENHYPLLTAAHWSGAVTQQTCSTYMQPTFHFSLLSEEQLLRTVLHYWEKQGGCLCILTNTVGKAQALFTDLQAQGVPREELLLFHARFTAQTRQRLEQQCISLFGKDGKRPERFIVIGTQVLEQSLDVDFDAMFTEIAPIDLLLQRAGRVFRHQKTKRPTAYTQPTIFVIYPEQKDFGISAKIYEPLLLHRTKAFLENNPQITVPSDMRNAIETIYLETLTAEELSLGMEMQFKKQMSQNMAEGVILTPPNPNYFFATETAAPFSLFTQEDQDSTLVSIAKTRQSDDSVSAAFLSPTLFALACSETPTKEITQQVLLHSVSLRRFPIEPILSQATQGQGALKHCYLFCLVEGEVLDAPQCTVRNDIDLGIVIERK
ncbi:MAG: CRISPR-associated helicase Cas3' [Faecalibacterium sp.]